MPGTEKDWKQATREFCEAATYPLDNGVVNLQDVFKGEIVGGYWPKVAQVRWKPATIADLDTRVVLGGAGQVWYGATWLHVPETTEFDIRFHGHQQTTLRWFLNGEPIKPTLDPNTKQARRVESALKVKLNRGWNQLQFRGYCTGYAPFRVGAVLTADESKLWTVLPSAAPH